MGQEGALRHEESTSHALVALSSQKLLKRIGILVPSKGLEPPHPCEYMDLNHARLPIPPRWHLQQCGGPKSADQEELQESILQWSYRVSNRQGQAMSPLCLPFQLCCHSNLCV